MAVVELMSSKLVYELLFAALVGLVSKWLYDRRKQQQVRYPESRGRHT